MVAAEWIFWFSFLSLAYTYALYPVLIWILARSAPRPWRRSNSEPNISIILAVHNGGHRVRDQVLSLLAADYSAEKVQVIVVSDGSDDGTNEMLTTIRHPRLVVEVCEQRRGKAAALNSAFPHATGEILVFVDVRPHVVAGSLKQLISNFGDPTVGCAAGRLLLRKQVQDGVTDAVGGVYWRYEQWIRECESAVDSPCGVYGGFYAIRRDLLTYMPEGLILDDMFQPLSVVRQGYRSVLDDSALVVDSWPASANGEFSRKVRTLAGNFQLITLAPWLLSSENRIRYQLVSHKLLRLIAPVAFLTFLCTSVMLEGFHPFYATMLLAQILFYVSGTLGLVSKVGPMGRLAGAPAAFLLLNAAVVVGFAKFVSVRRALWRIWTVPGEQQADIQ